jgi:hypothetical protein
MSSTLVLPNIAFFIMYIYIYIYIFMIDWCSVALSKNIYDTSLCRLTNNNNNNNNSNNTVQNVLRYNTNKHTEKRRCNSLSFFFSFLILVAVVVSLNIIECKISKSKIKNCLFFFDSFLLSFPSFLQQPTVFFFFYYYNYYYLC